MKRAMVLFLAFLFIGSALTCGAAADGPGPQIEFSWIDVTADMEAAALMAVLAMEAAVLTKTAATAALVSLACDMSMQLSRRRFLTIPNSQAAIRLRRAGLSLPTRCQMLRGVI